MAKKFELTRIEKKAIEKTLKVVDYEDFEQAQKNYYELTRGDFEKKLPRSRHSFSAKALRKLLTGADYFVVSVGVNSLSEIRFCFQKMIKNADGTYEIVEKDVLSSFDPVSQVHPVNGVPNVPEN